jgi:hypothetical protein
MDPMSDDSMCNQLLVAHVCHTMLCFGLQLGKVWHCASESQAKIDGISIHKISSVAAEPFHVLHMDPMSDDSMCNQLLVAHVCPTPCFVLSCSWEKFGTVPPNSSQN